MDPETASAVDYIARLESQFAKTMHPDMRKALDRLCLVARDLEHSEEFVIVFLGYLCASLHKKGIWPIMPDFMLGEWEKFKADMNKQTGAN
jgi:hypothetical protein